MSKHPLMLAYENLKKAKRHKLHSKIINNLESVYKNKLLFYSKLYSKSEILKRMLEGS